MSRPMLLCGFTFGVGAYICSFAGIRAAYVLLAASALALAVFVAVKPLHKVISIPGVSISLIAVSLIFMLVFAPMLEKAYSFEGETEFCGKVVSVPSVKGDTVSFEVKTHSIGNEFTDEKMICVASSCDAPEIYDCIAVSGAYICVADGQGALGRVSRFADGVYLRAFFSDGYQFLYEEERTPFYYCLKAREFAISAILSGISGDSGAIVCAMVTGEQGNVSQSAYSAFSNSGAAHILAVSGLHLILFTSVISLFLKLIGCGERLKSVILITLSLLYCAFVGFLPSCVRAWIMLSVLFSAPFFSRKADGLNSLGFAVLLVTLCNPYASGSLGFMMSVFATMGVLTLGQHLSRRFRYVFRDVTENRLKKLLLFICDTFSVTTGVTVLLLPISVYFFGKVSLAAPLTNLFVIPMAYITMSAGAFGAVLSPLSFASDILFTVSGAAADAILHYVTVLSGFGFSSIPVKARYFTVWLCVCAVLAAAAFAVKKKKGKTLLVPAVAYASVISFFVFSFLSFVPHSNSIRAYALPAGNGACVLLENGNSYAVIANGVGSYTAYNAIRNYMAFVPANSLEALVMTGSSDGDRELYDSITGCFTPGISFLSPALYIQADTPKSDESVICDSYGHFFLWEEIEIEVFNTEEEKYAIMEHKGSILIVSFSEKNDTCIMREDIRPAKLVCAGLPVNCDCSFESIVISGTEKRAAEQLEAAGKLCDNVSHTYTNGAVKIW